MIEKKEVKEMADLKALTKRALLVCGIVCLIFGFWCVLSTEAVRMTMIRFLMF